MRIAVPRYLSRIAPRFGFTEDVLIVEVQGQEVTSEEVIPLDGYAPHEIPNLLSKIGVQVVLTGGISDFFQEIFRALGIEVVWGLIGPPEEGIKRYISRELDAAPDRCFGLRARRGCGRRRREFGREEG